MRTLLTLGSAAAVGVPILLIGMHWLALKVALVALCGVHVFVRVAWSMCSKSPPLGNKPKSYILVKDRRGH